MQERPPQVENYIPETNFKEPLTVAEHTQLIEEKCEDCHDAYRKGRDTLAFESRQQVEDSLITLQEVGIKNRDSSFLRVVQNLQRACTACYLGGQVAGAYLKEYYTDQLRNELKLNS